MGDECTVNTLSVNGMGAELTIGSDDTIENLITTDNPGHENILTVFCGKEMADGGSSLTIGSVGDDVTVLATGGTLTMNGSSSHVNTVFWTEQCGPTVIDNSTSGGAAESESPLVLRPNDAIQPAGLSGDTPVSVDFAYYHMLDKLLGQINTPGKMYPPEDKPTYMTQPSLKASGQVTITANDLSYNALKTIFTAELETEYPLFDRQITAFQLVMKKQDGTLYTEILYKDRTDPVESGEVCSIRALYCPFNMDSGFSGLNVLTTTTSATGTGILGGNGSGSSGGRFILRSTGASRHGTTPTDPGSTTDPADPGASDPGAAASPGSQTGPTGTTAGTDAGEKAPNTLRAVVTALPGKGQNTYRLAVYDAAGRRANLPAGASVRAKMRFELPADWKADSIFAVFRLPDGSLKAARATYDPGSGTLSFAADTAGEFTLVSFEFHGKLYGKEFYSALETYLAAL